MTRFTYAIVYAAGRRMVSERRWPTRREVERMARRLRHNGRHAGHHKRDEDTRDKRWAIRCGKRWRRE